MHLEHPLLQPKAIQFRGYQANLARIAADQDTLVVLPTGMGKTIVALLVIADAWKAGARRILLLAPTRPLVEQHVTFLKSVLVDDVAHGVRGLTGTVPPSQRESAYQEGVIVATPQVVQNDVVGGRAPAFDWIIYDECHRAVGDYPYVFLGEHFRTASPEHRRLGLTASPGHDVQKIDAVRRALGLSHVEIRTPSDPDVAEYVQEIDTTWETLPLPKNLERVVARLHEALQERVKALKKIGFLKNAPGRPTKRALLEMGRDAQRMIKQTSDPEPSWYQALSLQAQAMKLLHALEQVQTQGAAAFVSYMDGLRKDAEGPKASKASRVLAEDPRVNQAYHIARHDESENPKMGRVETLVKEQLESDADSRVIVFTHYRTTCEAVAERLATISGVKPVVFVGQGKRRGQGGLSQKQQSEVLDRFRAGEVNTLVATSVAEEGLDIPATDLVVFYEPIPSEIRSIQRRGRTGRNRTGRVVVLMTKGTQDEAAHWSARRKEQAMVKELHGLRAGLAGRPKQSRLDEEPPRGGPQEPAPAAADPIQDAVRVICDNREQAGGVVRNLHSLGAKTETRNLEIADFVLSDRVAVERKTASDFVESLLDGRLFDQMARLKEYPRPLLLLEGDGLGGHRNVSIEALFGALASVGLDFGITILATRDENETARMLMAVAKREQIRHQRHIAVRPAPPASDPDGQALHVLCGFPGLSRTRAQALLVHFGSLAAVFQADPKELEAVEGIGAKTAAEVRRVLDHVVAEAKTLSTAP